MSSKVRHVMPKHVALGMTMRHVTGSSNVIELFSGFLHSVSHTMVLRHDTALATQQLESCSLVPEGFLKNIPSILVWDNNDFLKKLHLEKAQLIIQMVCSVSHLLLMTSQELQKNQFT